MRVPHTLRSRHALALTLTTLAAACGGTVEQTPTDAEPQGPKVKLDGAVLLPDASPPPVPPPPDIDAGPGPVEAGPVEAATPDAAPDVRDAGPDVTPPKDATPDAPPDAPPTVAFGPCDSQYGSATCTNLTVPLNWANPAGPTIKVVAGKIYSKPTNKRQIWFLQGGPGGSASTFPSIASELRRYFPDSDLYFLEHRGVGESTELRCTPAGQNQSFAATAEEDIAQYTSDWSDCRDEVAANWGTDLSHFSTTAAARDLGFAIEKTAETGKPTFVYGVSYGTYWAQRFLQVHPNLVSGVVLDSAVSPGVQYLSMYDIQVDKGARYWAEACKSDATCSSKLSTDPWARIEQIYAKHKAGHCPSSQMSKRGAFATVAGLLASNGYGAFALAALYRYDRCDPADVAALDELLVQLQFDSRALGEDYSVPLYYNVAFSELWETPAPSDADMIGRFNTAVFPTSMYQMNGLAATWPRYPRDGFVDKTPDTSIPILVLAGTLDIQTPVAYAQTLKAVYNKPGQSFVEVPWANHGVMFEGLEDGTTSCGARLMRQFVENPQKTLDTGCTASTKLPDFTDSGGLASFLFGTNQLWDNASPTPLLPRPKKGRTELTASQQREFDKVRRGPRLY